MTIHIVFISYSHKDEIQKDRLLTQLGVLQAGGLISSCRVLIGVVGICITGFLRPMFNNPHFPENHLCQVSSCIAEIASGLSGGGGFPGAYGSQIRSRPEIHTPLPTPITIKTKKSPAPTPQRRYPLSHSRPSAPPYSEP